ncbi:MAG: type II secretion system protein [Planctomycetes bacterium]|nr:type II secretion system protein [Planctomycetota bacterium]
MKPGSLKSGFTLIEMLLVVAIIAILVSMVVGVTKRIDDQSKERLCRNTITLIGNALEQFRDFGYEYKGAYATLGLTFPIDCNGMQTVLLEPTLQSALGIGLSVVITPEPTHDLNFSGSEVLYFVLSQVPDCRKTLDKIDKSLISNKTKNGDELKLVIGASVSYPLYRFIDSWGTALRYDYYQKDSTWYPILGTKKTFPVITSAGPDKRFDTADDISNVK